MSLKGSVWTLEKEKKIKGYTRAERYGIQI